MLDHFCEFINIQLPYIRRHRDCPNDINEAFSSLIFASARCAQLPAIRKLFGERYRHRFETVAIELLPGNLANCEVVRL
ncbi:IST1-LIKE 10 [Hibiscus trionum]|uniref:IST1-LIKE 10 n=1 Tax=Hibiscus trionum TaxID=183268 RepID=A0A9W7LUK3_HIBTR|nr:IST1-LIKE 10 [Hibiscus trionum]